MSLPPHQPRWLAAPATLLLFPALLLSQSPADRAALESLRDTLPSVSEPAILTRLSQWSGDPNTRRIREALVLLRIGSLGTDRKPYDAALRKAELAIDFQSKWPWGWYTLGLIDLAMAQRGFPAKASSYNLVGFTYRESGVAAFARSVQADSSFIPAVAALSQLVLAQGHKLLPDIAAPALRLAAYVDLAPTNASLALHRLEMQAGRYETALTAAEEYLRRGGDSAIGRLEQARALQSVGRREEAVAAYYEGLRAPSPEGRLEYRNDLAWVAREWELTEFDTLPLLRLTEWVNRFWDERDALSLRNPGERLAEHLRRWVFAHKNYLMHRSPDSPHHHGEGLMGSDQENIGNFGMVAAMVLNDLDASLPAFQSYHRQQWEVDDRGVIYLRQGEPTRVSINPVGPPNESWQYDIPEGSRIFHFLGSRALGTQAATTLVAALPLEPGMLDSRGNLDTRYTAMASDIQGRMAQVRTVIAQDQNRPIDTSGMWAERRGSGFAGVSVGLQTSGGPASQFHPEIAYREVQRGRSAIAAGVTTDAFPRHFKNDLGAIAQVYGVGLRPGASSQILATFAVPGRSLTPVSQSDGGAGLAYPVSIRIIAMDREQGISRQLDTTRIFASADTLRGDQHLIGLAEMAVPPGRYQVRILVTSPGVDAATGAGRDSVVVPPPEQQLFLSDLILGRTGSGLTWAYEATLVPLNPLNAYPRGADADLFYELGGLAEGGQYQVTTSVRQARGNPNDKPAIQTSFALTASGGYQQVSRGLGLANLRPGYYLLEVTVQESASGRSVSRRRALNILEK